MTVQRSSRNVRAHMIDIGGNFLGPCGTRDQKQTEYGIQRIDVPLREEARPSATHRTSS